MTEDGRSENVESETKKSTAWNYDEILQHLGQFGKFQFFCFLLYCIPTLFPGMLVMSYSFLGGIPDYRCYVEGCDNATATTYLPEWLNNTLPFEESLDGVERPNRCQIYNNTWQNTEQCYVTLPEEQRVDCSQWVYDQSIFTSTIVTEFTLTCEDEWKQTMISTMYMAGMLVGAFSFGSIADWLGRKYAFLILTTWCGAFTVGSSFAPNYETFAALRFFVGMGGAGYLLVLIVWSVEAVGPKYRITCGFILQAVFAVGSCLTGVIAYYVRYWRTLELIIGIPLLVFNLFWFMPESPRWLIAEGRYSEAQQIIERIAKINKKTVPKELMPENETPKSAASTSKETLEEFSSSVSVQTEGSSTTEAVAMKQNESIWKVFTNPVLCKRIFVMFACWIAASLGYYGLSMSTSNLAGDFYVNYELTMLVEIPSYIIGIFIMDKIGRRFTLTAGLIISGVACLAAGLVPREPIEAVIVLSLIGKFPIALVYAVVYSYTAELFPTAVRSAAVGICSTSARIGGILSPIIADIGKTNPGLPYVIFGLVTLIAGLLSFVLPETRGCELPETMKDAENLEKRTLSWTRCCRSTKKPDSNES